MTERLSGFFGEYGTVHQTSGNKICHYLGIPMIFVSLLGLTALIPISLFSGGFDAGQLILCLAGFWYVFLDFKIGIPFVTVAAGSYFLGKTVSVPALWSVFVLGWILQGIGHYRYEKRSPAFFKNFEHLLIGPLWIFAKFVGYR